jgi:hypothetical protein
MYADAKFRLLSEGFGSPARERVRDERILGAESLTQEFDRYSMRIWIVLSIVMSLTITSIFAKHEMVGLSIIPFLVLPVSLTLYFRARIASLGAGAYAGTLIVVLSAAVLFGI